MFKNKLPKEILRRKEEEEKEVCTRRTKKVHNLDHLSSHFVHNIMTRQSKILFTL